MYNEVEDQPDDLLMDLIARYGQTIMKARDELEKWVLKGIHNLLGTIFRNCSSKRTVDFGLSRGYSGAQEAKHRMAMQIANFAGKIGILNWLNFVFLTENSNDAGGPGRKRRSGNKQGIII